MNMTAETSVDLQLYELLEEFIGHLRQGQGVSVREFAKRYPDFRDRIVADFPALLMAEGLKPRIPLSTEGNAEFNSEDLPELIAGYRVIRQIGAGGMGIVYEAEHPRLSRRLAIKVLNGRKGSRTAIDRFRREAEAASRLNHPGIVPVFDFGDQNGVPYIAMALIEGQSLDQKLEQYRTANLSAEQTKSNAGLQTKASKISSGTANFGSVNTIDLIGPGADFRSLARLGADIAAALAHAHANQTIHRDIKPGNLILDETGRIWVTDFGLAKVRDDLSDLSRTGDVIGTPRFMAPEQVRGLCDERSDIYSLGITLYEMASGTRAWDSLNTAQLLKVRASAELPELAEHAPFVPRALADIIMKACSHRPEDRYQSAQELQVVLNRYAHGQKTGDRRRRPRHSSSVLDRRWVVLGGSVGIPLLTFLLMFVFSVGPWATARITTPEALMSLVKDEKQREKIVEELPDVIEAAITSRDANVREQAADLTFKVISEAMNKSDAGRKEKEATMKKVASVTEEFKKSGFVYDRMQHPLTNAVRNLDLARQISELKLPAAEKLIAQGKIASVGEALRRKIISDSQARSLLTFLPLAAQSGPVTQRVDESRLRRFIAKLNQVFDEANAAHRGDPEQLKQLEREVRSGRIALPENGVGLKPSRDLQIPAELRDRFLPPKD